MRKPLGRKAYGSIPHLPGSKAGPGDHYIQKGQARIATKKVRDSHDKVFCHEKLDGSNVAVAKLEDGRIVPLVRAGYLASSSPWLQHRIFGDWVFANFDRFYALLNSKEWVCGEWLAQAHGTLYKLKHEPFVAFDLFSNGKRIPQSNLLPRLRKVDLVSPTVLQQGAQPVSIDQAQKILANPHLNYHGATEPKEGAVWRVERKGEVDFLCKWVRSDFPNGKYLPEISRAGETKWNDGIEEYLPDKAIKKIKNAANVAQVNPTHR